MNGKFDEGVGMEAMPSIQELTDGGIGRILG